MKYLENDIYKDCFKIHLFMVPGLIKKAFKNTFHMITATNVCIKAEKSTNYKEMLSEVDKSIKNIFFYFQ